MSTVERFCGNSQSVKPVDCFRRRASLLIFDGILNVTLTEELFTTGVTQGNLEKRVTNSRASCP